MIRTIIEIDRDKCNGCGACAHACHEGAIGMVDGKAVLLRDDYCDGLGDCLPTCPTGAIRFVQREAAAYDAAAVLAKKAAALKGSAPVRGGGCPGSRSQALRPAQVPAASGEDASAPLSALSQWPVQLKLLPVEAPFYDGASLLVAADLLRLLPRGLPRPFHGGPDYRHRLPQAGRGRLYGKAHGNSAAQCDPGCAGGPYGGPLLRRH